MPRRNYQRRTAGPGRPRKYAEGIKFFAANIAGSTYDDLYELKEELNVPFSELLTWLVKLAKGQIDKLKLLAKTRHQEEYIKQLEKEKQALLEELDKERKEKEKWKFRYEELKQSGSSKLTGIAKHLADIAEVAQEGMSWKQACVLANIRDPDKIRKLLETVFKIRDEYNNLAQVFAIKDEELFPELKDWVLVKPSEKADIISYVFVRKGREKAFLKEQKLKAEPEKALKVGDAAAEITKVLKDWLESYELVLTDRHGKERAERMARDFQRFALKRLIDKYGFTAVFDVVYSDPHFKRVILPLLEFYAPKEEKEVVAE